MSTANNVNINNTKEVKGDVIGAGGGALKIIPNTRIKYLKMGGAWLILHSCKYFILSLN